MNTVTLSSEYQVRIPEDVCERLNLRPGQRMEVFAVGGRVEFVPIRPTVAERESMDGVEGDFERDVWGVRQSQVLEARAILGTMGDEEADLLRASSRQLRERSRRW